MIPHSSLDYEDLLKSIKASNPKNQTDLIYAIQKYLGGGYDPDVFQVVCTLDPDLKSISDIEGPSISSNSSICIF